MAHAAAWATLDEARSVAKINGHKSQRRRQQAILGTIYDSIGNNPPTQTRVDEITEAVKRMDIQLDHIAEGYQHLTMIGSKTAEEYEAATEAVEAEHLPARTTARNIVERHEQRLRMQQQQQPQQQQQAPERAREVKLIGEMKPDTLHRQATPVELRYWLKCFRDYHRASHMDAAPADQQQRYMLALMDEPLRGDMLVELGEDTPIWPAEGAPNDNNTCVGVLKSLFRTRLSNSTAAARLLDGQAAARHALRPLHGHLRGPGQGGRPGQLRAPGHPVPHDHHAVPGRAVKAAAATHTAA